MPADLAARGWELETVMTDKFGSEFRSAPTSPVGVAARRSPAEGALPSAPGHSASSTPSMMKAT